MTKIKLCGLGRIGDVETANELMPDFIGFVFAPVSRRYITYDRAKELKSRLSGDIPAVGVFVDERPEIIADLLMDGVIDIAQLHGKESPEYIRSLRRLTQKKLIKAFRVEQEADIRAVQNCPADYVLLDSGAGTGTIFDWELIRTIDRPYFLAGGLHAGNAAQAIRMLHPYAVDVSSGIETNGRKDPERMKAFVKAVRESLC